MSPEGLPTTRAPARAWGQAEAAPTLSVVIVNHDGAADTLACLASLYANPPAAPFEIIVLDNYSHDGLVAAVEQQYPAVRLAVNTQREGFARNYNRGLALARGQYMLVLNNDTLLHPGALDLLLHALEADPATGMAGPRLLDSTGRTQIDCARRAPTPASYLRDQLLTDMGLPLGRLYAGLLRRRIERRASGPVEAISGACMLISRAAFERVGPLDEGFKFYYEDTDWCKRFAAHGYSIAFVAEARITHLGDRAARKVKVWAKQQEYWGALRYFRRHWGLAPWALRCLWLATLYNWLVRGLLMLLAEAAGGGPGGARAYLYLWRWLLTLGDPLAHPETDRGSRRSG